MTVYLDASVLVALFTVDRFTAEAEAVLLGEAEPVIVSDLAVAEFSAVVGRRVRTGQLSADDALAAFLAVDAWAAESGRLVLSHHGDVAAATQFIRRLELKLRTPDALHIAMARRLGAKLCTFDVPMAQAAADLGVTMKSNENGR